MIQLDNVSKQYGKNQAVMYALKDVSLQIDQGEFLAIMGPSGSGKSTLLHILGCLDVPTEGSYLLEDKPIKDKSKHELARLRNTKIGFVFQHFALISELTALDNVMLPLMYRGILSWNPINRKKQQIQQAQHYLSMVGLADHMHKRPGELSGGQQQRVAIARALVTEPKLILADEPTGALDQKTGEEIMKLIQGINEQGKTVLIVTHDPNVASYSDRILFMRDGEMQTK